MESPIRGFLKTVKKQLGFPDSGQVHTERREVHCSLYVASVFSSMRKQQLQVGVFQVSEMT